MTSIDSRRRTFLGRSMSFLGAGLGGSMLATLTASCDNGSNKANQSVNTQSSRYLPYKDKLDQCFSAVIQDVMDTMNLRNQCMAPTVKPLLPTMKLWGEARTMYMEEVTTMTDKPFQIEMELLDSLKPGQVIVGQCNARTPSAAWGGLLTNAAIGHGGHGVVLDGGARDYDEIVELGFPTFCSLLTPYDSLGRMDGISMDTPIVCGGVPVNPGDLVYGDVVGVVIIPQEAAKEVIARAWGKVQGESRVREELRSGASVVDTFEKYGIL